MRTEARVFLIVAGFLGALAVVYYLWTDGQQHRPEWAGTMTLLLSGVLCGLCGFYFGFVARRIEPRPEDRADAEVSDGAGQVGFFAPHSFWPLGIGASTAVAATGVALGQPWLLAVGVLGVLATVVGLVVEFYVTRGES
jgi:uncharacterized membrane protein HdeD (DUF308 family)